MKKRQRGGGYYEGRENSRFKFSGIPSTCALISRLFSHRSRNNAPVYINYERKRSAENSNAGKPFDRSYFTFTIIAWEKRTGRGKNARHNICV